jgi:Family of unknown function (DUF6502)
MIKGALDIAEKSGRPRRVHRKSRATTTGSRARSGDLTRQVQAIIPKLFSVGLSVRDLYEIAKRQALVAAVPMSSHLSGRPNQSLLSAITGLTRPEIRSLLRDKPLNSQMLVASANSRSIRVAREWLKLQATDPSRIRLPIRARKGASFQDLVKNNAGDVPLAAMQKEMLRLGWVRLHQSRNELELLKRDVLLAFSELL